MPVIYGVSKMCAMSHVAAVALAFGDETRLRLLSALLDGDATVSELADRLGLVQPRVSTHLAHLRAAGIVSMRAEGRHRVYHVDHGRVAAALAALEAMAKDRPGAAKRSTQAAREVRRDSSLRQARSCYDHLAGVAGVHLLDELLRRAWLAPVSGNGRVSYALTERGEQALRARGVEIAGVRQARRSFAHACLDWTERRPHLGGALGAAVLTALAAARVVHRQPQTRALTVSPSVDRWLSGGQ